MADGEINAEPPGPLRQNRHRGKKKKKPARALLCLYRVQCLCALRGLLWAGLANMMSHLANS